MTLHPKARVQSALLRENADASRLYVGAANRVASGAYYLASTRDGYDSRVWFVSFVGATEAEDVGRMLDMGYADQRSARALLRACVKHVGKVAA